MIQFEPKNYEIGPRSSNLHPKLVNRSAINQFGPKTTKTSHFGPISTVMFVTIVQYGHILSFLMPLSVIWRDEWKITNFLCAREISFSRDSLILYYQAYDRPRAPDFYWSPTIETYLQKISILEISKFSKNFQIFYFSFKTMALHQLTIHQNKTTHTKMENINSIRSHQKSLHSDTRKNFINLQKTAMLVSF